MSKSILVIDFEADLYKALLKSEFPALQVHTAGSAADIGDEVMGVEAIFTFGWMFNEALLRRAGALQWVQALASGTDAITQQPALQPGIVVTSARGIHGPQVTEMALLQMMLLARDYSRVIINQSLAKWERRPQALLFEKTVVIVGTGVIALELARRCKVLGMTVVGLSATPRPLPDFDSVLARSELQQAAAQADFLVLLAPYTPDTERMIDAAVLKSMKPTAFVINLARGGVIDDDALLEAVRARRIAGAALDAFRQEPLPPEHPFWREQRILVSPHLAGMSDIYARQVLPILIENTRCFLEDRWSDMVNVVRR